MTQKFQESKYLRVTLITGCIVGSKSELVSSCGNGVTLVDQNSCLQYLSDWFKKEKPSLSVQQLQKCCFPSFISDYYAVVTIPAGARSIHLHEMQISNSYLAVRNLSKKYYLTGDWTIDWPGKFPFAGTVFDYQRSFNHPESLYAAGPTNETLVFEVSFLLFILPLMSITELVTTALALCCSSQRD